MFRATHHPPSGTQKLQLQPLVLHTFLIASRCDSSAIAVTDNQKRILNQRLQLQFLSSR
jgi:hypothetical protein